MLRIPENCELPMVQPRIVRNKVYQRIVDLAKFDLITAIQEDMKGSLLRQVTMQGGRALIEHAVARVKVLKVSQELEIEVWCPVIYFKPTAQELAAYRGSANEAEPPKATEPHLEEPAPEEPTQ